MYSLLYFDTEDSISPPEAGNDDIVLWIADVLTRHGITGSFHIIGDKARLLEKRRRHDVIEAVKRHDVSSHYNHGSIHPTTTELVSVAEWDDGVRIALECERPGFADVERIFGRCAGLTRHGGSYAPQITHAAGLCGKVFYGMPFQLPGHRAFWFAGTLCFSILGLVVDEAGNGPAYMEGVYHDDTAFDTKLAALRPILANTVSREPFTALFGSHPLRMNTTDFACFNHYGGVNRPDPQAPPQRPEHEKKTIRRNFERFIAFLAEVPGLKIRGLTDLARIFGSAPKQISNEELDAYARQVVDGDDVPLHDRFSPAELLTAMAGGGNDVARVIGPTQAMSEAPLRNITRAQLDTITASLTDHVLRTGRLPNDVNCAAILDVLSQARIGRGAGPWSSSPKRSPCPRASEAWLPLVASMKNWRVFGPDFDSTRIIAFTRLQSWSAKPAHADDAAA